MSVRSQAQVQVTQTSDSPLQTGILQRQISPENRAELDEQLLLEAQPSHDSRFQQNFSRVSVRSSSLPFIQPKLKIGQPGDRYEDEADRIAKQVVERINSAPARSSQLVDPAQTPPLQQQAEVLEEEDEEEIIQAKPAIAPTPIAAYYLQTQLQPTQRRGQALPTNFRSRGIGQPAIISSETESTVRQPDAGAPMPEAIQQRIESHIGADLSSVRVHTGEQASRAATNLQARAFTYGNHIFLNRGESSYDLRLMAHESVHVVQQQPALADAQARLLTAPYQVQRIIPDYVLEKLDDYARYIPGYTLFTVIVGYNPLRLAPVQRTPINLVQGLMELVPFGAAIFDKLQELGILQQAFDWVQQQLERFNLTTSRLERLLDEAYTAMDFFRLDPIDYNTAVLERKFGGLLNDVIAFANSLVDQIIQLIKDAAIGVADELLAENQAWALLKKVLHYDPLRGVTVDATTVEILEDFLVLINKQQELEQMREQGTLQETADWLDTQFAIFTALLAELSGIFTAAWEAIQPANLPNLRTNLQALANRVVGFLGQVWEFASTVAIEVLKLIKRSLLNWLSSFAHEIPGFHLLTVIAGKNPFTEEEVPLTPTNLIRGFMSLIPGGERQFQQMQETGVIPAAAQRIESAMAELGISWEFVQGLFLDIWNDFTIEDLLKPLDAFTRVLDRFQEPLNRLFTFVIEVIKVMLELVLALMNFPTNLIGSIITNALQALDDIQRDPVGFLINLIETMKLGFSNFFDNIVEHLLGGLADWLFSEVREAGIEPPTDLTFESILGFVLDILGLSMNHLWELLAEHVGQETVDRIRGAIDRLAGAWSFIQDVQERGIVAVWEYIESQLSNLWDMVLAQVQEWTMERIIDVGMRWLLSLLDATGITPVINSAIAVFNAIQSAIEYLNEMLAVINDFVSTVASIARGDIQPGAERMEQGLSNSLPIVIGFLANQFGLDDIGDRLQEIIAGARELVDAGLNWLIEQALRLGQAVLRSLGLGGGAATTEQETAPQTDDPEHDAQVQAGLNAINEKESSFLQNGEITHANAEQVAAEIRREHPVFRSFTVVDGEVTWDYEYVASPATKVTGEKKAEGIIILPANIPNLALNDQVRIHTGLKWEFGEFQRFYTQSGTDLIEVKVGSSKFSKRINTYNEPSGWTSYNIDSKKRLNYGSLDSQSRPQGIEATLVPPLQQGTTASYTPPGFGGGAINHARGHLLAKQLGGSGSEPRNIVTLFHIPVNTPIMRGHEGKVRKAVEEKKEIVEYKVTPSYSGLEPIPTAIVLEASGDGGFLLSESVLNQE